MTYPPIRFPDKLRAILDFAEDNGFEDIVGWLSDGLSFRIIKPKEFATTIMPHFFRHTNYRSFQRLLYHYDFSKIRNGLVTDAYSNPQFTKENRMECPKLLKKKQSKSRSHAASSTSTATQKQSVSNVAKVSSERRQRFSPSNKDTAHPKSTRSRQDKSTSSRQDMFDCWATNPLTSTSSADHFSSTTIVTPTCSNSDLTYSSQSPWTSPSSHNEVLKVADMSHVILDSDDDVSVDVEPTPLPPGIDLSRLPQHQTTPCRHTINVTSECISFHSDNDLEQLIAEIF